MEIDKSSSEWLYFRRHSSWLRATPTIKRILRNKIIEEENAYPGFAEKLRMLALNVLDKKENTHDLGIALSVLSVLGVKEDIPLIESVFELEDEELSKDIKACVFEIRQTSNS